MGAILGDDDDERELVVVVMATQVMEALMLSLFLIVKTNIIS